MPTTGAGQGGAPRATAGATEPAAVSERDLHRKEGTERT